MLSVANKDRGTIGNSYWPTVSLISIFWPALALHHTCGKGPILLKLHNLVCCSHPHDLCTGFPCKEFSLLHGRPKVNFARLDSFFHKTVEQSPANFTLFTQIFLYCFWHNNLGHEVEQVSMCVREWMRKPFNCGCQLCYIFLFVYQDSCSEVVMMTLSLGRHPQPFSLLVQLVLRALEYSSIIQGFHVACTTFISSFR